MFELLAAQSSAPANPFEGILLTRPDTMAFGTVIAKNDAGSILAVADIWNVDQFGEESGAVFIYENQEGVWTMVQKITPGVDTEQFGESLSMSSDGSLLAVSVMRDPTVNQYPYIYERVNGVYVRTNLPYSMGGRIAVSGDGQTIAFTRNIAEDPSWLNFESDGISIFKKVNGEWVENSLIPSQNSEAIDMNLFDQKLSYDGNSLLTKGGTQAGVRSVVLFQKTEADWVIDYSIESSLSGPGFEALALSYMSSDATCLVIGDYYQGYLEPETYGYEGKLRVYFKTGSVWGEPEIIQNPNGPVLDYFGGSLSISNDKTTFVVGAPYGEYPQVLKYVRVSPGVYQSSIVYRQPEQWRGSAGDAVAISGDNQTVFVGDGNYVQDVNDENPSIGGCVLVVQI